MPNQHKVRYMIGGQFWQADYPEEMATSLDPRLSLSLAGELAVAFSGFVAVDPARQDLPNGWVDDPYGLSTIINLVITPAEVTFTKYYPGKPALVSYNLRSHPSHRKFDNCFEYFGGWTAGAEGFTVAGGWATCILVPVPDTIFVRPDAPYR